MNITQSSFFRRFDCMYCVLRNNIWRVVLGLDYQSLLIHYRIDVLVAENRTVVS